MKQSYAILFHPTKKDNLPIQNYMWVWVLHIHKKHSFVMNIMAWAFFVKLKYQSCNLQNRRSGDMANLLFETYNNSVTPHGNHIFPTSYNTAMETMCTYKSSNYALPHWISVLCCCAQCLCMDFQIPESYQHHSNISPTIWLHVYKHIASCNLHGRHPFKQKTVSIVWYF